LIPISAELAATVDEYVLTKYPLLERIPTAADFVWYGVFRVGDRVIGLKPERMLSYRGFYEWWKRVEATAGVRHRKPHMTRQTFATDVLDATEGDLRRKGAAWALLDPRHRGLPPLVEDAHGERRQGAHGVPPRKPQTEEGRDPA
jgi:integrase